MRQAARKKTSGTGDNQQTKSIHTFANAPSPLNTSGWRFPGSSRDGEAVCLSGSSSPLSQPREWGYLCPYWHLPLLLFLSSILSSTGYAGRGISVLRVTGFQPGLLC